MNNPNALKIGILTFHRCINYGSYWQARCLAEGLQSMRHNAVILDHNSRRINLSEWKCAYQPNLPSPVIESDFPLYREKIFKFFKAFKTLPLSPRFNVDHPEEMENYDVVIVGSDEVWNLSHPWYGKHPFFYGDGIKAQKLISYAASFGSYPAEREIENEWANRLSNFDAISVRDENSQTIVKNALGIEPQMVLDPCLQFPIFFAGENLESLPKPYAAVYGHNFSQSFINKTKQWAADKNLPLISIGYRNDWADEQWITAGPQEFATFISQSEAVITNFFHGCVFALVNKKSFVCETTPYRSNKLNGLMKKIGGEKHLVNEETSSSVYKNLLNEHLSENIFSKISQLRQTSNEYLIRALNVKQLQVA